MRWMLSLLLIAAGAAVAFGQDDGDPPLDETHLTHGPFVGHATSSQLTVWARASRGGDFELVIFDATDSLVDGADATASAANDLCLSWTVRLGSPDAPYRGVVRHGDRELASLDLHTTPTDSAPRARLAFASCAHEGRFPGQPAWGAMNAAGAEVVVLLGDTPYIDSTDLAVQRRRYREFYAQPDLAALLETTPFHATWDDHDFGLDDTDGRLEGKQDSRRAFIEYHPGSNYGRAATSAGIYSSFRRGPVEVFLLDTRWFAGTGPSFADASLPTLLGAEQWTWLQKNLVASTAPFKIIASGMVWNGAVRPGKTDHWMTYAHEREALFRFLGEHDIGGVVLMGGDIHRSRALRYPTKELCGYELTELITSPVANTVIASANAPSPYLLHDVGHEQTFLLIAADTSVEPATLVARCMDEQGQVLFEVALDSEQLSRQ